MLIALTEHKERHEHEAKDTICVWFDKDAHEAARFYAATFPNREVTAVHGAPSDLPGRQAGRRADGGVKVLSIPCLGLNGGPGVHE